MPDTMARVAATLDDADRTADGARGVIELGPEGDADVNVGRLRHLADIEVDLPSGSDRPYVGGLIVVAKQVMRRALRWYVAPIVEQQSRFNHANVDLLERLRLRLVRMSGAPPARSDGGGVTAAEVTEVPKVTEAGRLATAWSATGRYPDRETRLARYVPWFEGCRRVVHVDCPDGELVRALARERVPAYGVTVDEEVVEAGRAHNFEVLLADPISHIGALDPGSVDGLFCSLIAKPRSAAELVGLLTAAAAALGPAAAVVIETANADDLQSAELADSETAGGRVRRPLHPGAVHAALVATGFSNARYERIAPLAPPIDPSGSESSLAAQVERLDRVLSRHPVTALVATRGVG